MTRDEPAAPPSTEAPPAPVEAPAESQAPAEPQAEPTRPWRAAVRVALPVWLTAYGLYALVTWVSWAVGTVPDDPAPRVASTLAESWQRWDAQLFVNLVEHGYAGNGPEYAAFFPLYPTIVTGVDAVLPGGVFGATIVVSAAMLLATLVVLYRLAETEFDARTARRSLWLLMAFPTAFYLAIGYNEGLFLALVLACVYALRREQWWLAGAFGGLATLTRSTGLLLAGAFAYEYVRRHGWRLRWSVLAGLLIPAGLAIYAAYLDRLRGDPFAFVSAQRSWQRELHGPWVAVTNTISYFSDRPRFSGRGSLEFLDPAVLVLVVTLLVLCFAGPWRLRRDQLVFPLFGCALVLVMLLTSPEPELRHPLMSVSRLSLEVFPIFFVLARIRALERPYTYLALGAQVLLLAIFARGGWVA